MECTIFTVIIAITKEIKTPDISMRRVIEQDIENFFTFTGQLFEGRGKRREYNPTDEKDATLCGPHDIPPDFVIDSMLVNAQVIRDDFYDMQEYRGVGISIAGSDKTKIMQFIETLKLHVEMFNNVNHAGFNLQYKEENFSVKESWDTVLNYFFHSEKLISLLQESPDAFDEEMEYLNYALDTVKNAG